jgi:hypothetical protein
MNKCHLNIELSSLEGTRCQFNGSRALIKLGIDVHQDYYVVVKQEDGTNRKPAQRFRKETFLHWKAKLKSQGGEIYAVYEACGFGFWIAAATGGTRDSLLRGLSTKTSAGFSSAAMQ